MRNYSLLIFISLVCSISLVRGQNEAQVSQYMFAAESYNPAGLARNDMMSLFALYRMQWVGMPNAPQELFFAANAPFKLFGKQHSAGVMFVNDNAGIFSTQQIVAQYAYRQQLGEGRLSAGINLGFLSQTIYGDSVRRLTSDYHDVEGDRYLPSSEVSDVAFDMGLGVSYTGKNFHVGVSLLHLFEPELNMDDYVHSFIGRAMYIDGGMDFPLTDSRYKLKPRALVKTDFVSWTADIALLMERNENLWFGVGWRLQDAIVFYLGMNIFDAVSIGYSFDLATNELITQTAGSHEIFLRYDFSFGKKKTNRYKSVRIL